MNEAQVQHFKRWPLLGVGTGAPEVEAPSRTYLAEVNKLRGWIETRLSWLDANMPGSAENCGVSTDQVSTPDMMLRLFPNPCSEDLYIESDKRIKVIKVYSLSGKVVRSEQPYDSFSVHLNISDLEKGIYLVKIISSEGSIRTEKVIIQ